MSAAAGLVGQTRRLPPNVRGALWMLLSAALFTAMVTLVKLLGGSYPAHVQNFYRQAAGLLIMLPFILRRGRAAFTTTKPFRMVFRAGLLTAATIFTFTSFEKLPLAEANTLSYTRNLWLTPLVVIFLRERVGPLRISATLAGFVGVLLITGGGLGEGADLKGFALSAAAGLTAAFLFAVNIVTLKTLTRDAAPSTLLVWAATLGFVFALPGLAFGARIPTPGDLALLAAMGVIGVASQATYIKAVEAGDPAAVAPVDYIRLIFTTVIGLMLFDETPTLWTAAGSVVIVGAALVVSLRELQLARRKAGAVEHPATPPLGDGV